MSLVYITVVIACSDGRRLLQIFNYYEKIVCGKRRGKGI